MKYEMKVFETDPFDIMCGECQEHEIEYWAPVTEEELRNDHDYYVIADKWVPEREKADLIADGMWAPTEPDFDKWLAEMIREGYIREVAE